MKSLSTYIQEKLIIKKSNRYKYFPQSKLELKAIIEKRIKDEGNEVDLNDIDVSNIKDMSYLFSHKDFNGDISNWEVSNVKDMFGMFLECKLFNKNISNWDVSNVRDMNYMFCKCQSFNQDISKWDVSHVTNMANMFYGCPIKEKYKPKFK